MLSYIAQVAILLVMLWITYRVAFRRGAASTVDAAQSAIAMVDMALQNLVEAHAVVNEANEEMILLHSSHVGFALDALDEHVRYTGKKLDPDAQHVIDQIRPYYETQTIH